MFLLQTGRFRLMKSKNFMAEDAARHENNPNHHALPLRWLRVLDTGLKNETQQTKTQAGTPQRKAAGLVEV